MSTAADIRAHVDAALGDCDGILGLDPAWVARDWLPPGRRLGLPEADYDLGERGFVCERWLASTTHADNRVGPADEGLSTLALGDGSEITLRDAVRVHASGILGAAYAASHDGLGRLAKIFDYAARIPYHIHPPAAQAAKVGRRSKDEAYYFPAGVELGAHPETFFGVHPWLAEGRRGDVLLPYLVDGDSDLILQHSRAEQQVAEHGFVIESGILHGPGTALTIELQEDSDTLSMFQALNAGAIIPKELLFKDVSAEDRRERGEAALLDWIDWEANGDPAFYEHRHIVPMPVAGSPHEHWIFCGSQRFSGKRLVLGPGERTTTTERGVHSVFVWRGAARWGGVEVTAGEPGRDELLVAHDRAIRPLEVVNDGSRELVAIKFFGPDINPDVPRPPFAVDDGEWSPPTR